MTSFTELLRAPSPDLGAIASHLDALGHGERVRQVREVPGNLQGELFAAARGIGALDAPYFVPDDVPDCTFVRHYGKNSLPAFSIFEKRFARPEPDSPVLWGFNHSSMMGLVGPGHFMLRGGPDAGEVHVDYYSVPPARLSGAPPLAPNDRGISALVYGHMIDVLRRVSAHVTIGRATKKGKETSNYFLLCREG